MTERSGRFPPFTTRRVCVIAADAPVRGVAVDHGIHVAGGDAEEQVGAPSAERLGAVPVRLRNDADAEALCLEHATDDGHAEAGVIHISVAGNDDDVAAVPAERVHLGARHRQERGRAKAVRPSTCGTPLCHVRFAWCGAD